MNVPQGWKLVPIEPTEDMSRAGSEAWSDKRQNSPTTRWARAVARVYRAMVERSPQPPAGGAGGTL